MSGRRGTRANIGTRDTEIAMSEARIDILRAGYEAFNRRDWPDMFQAAAPDFEMITAARVTNPGTYHGRTRPCR